MADITSPIMLDSTGQDIVTALGNVVSAITGPSAADVTYDGTTSGLSATDVQNAIDEIVTEKQDTLTFDATPTENSTNPVTSGGVYEDTQNVYEVMGQMGAKNLLNISSYNGATVASVTYTKNSDGSVSTSGSASSADSTTLASSITLPTGDYIVSGCPSGGGSTTYELLVVVGSNRYRDYGDGVSFSIANGDTIDFVQIVARNGQNMNGLTFYPMIRLASDTDNTFVPYAETNYQLTTSKANASALGTVENGPTASKAYSVGEHFSRFGNFCTVTQAIASGGTLTEGTNYSVGDVASNLIKQATFSGTTNSDGNISLDNTGRNILAALCDNAYTIVTLYKSSSTSTGAHITNTAATPSVIANTAVTGTYYYI